MLVLVGPIEEVLRRDHSSKVPQSLRELLGKSKMLVTGVCVDVESAPEGDDGVGGFLPRLVGPGSSRSHQDLGLSVQTKNLSGV